MQRHSREGNWSQTTAKILFTAQFICICSAKKLTTLFFATKMYSRPTSGVVQMSGAHSYTRRTHYPYSILWFSCFQWMRCAVRRRQPLWSFLFVVSLLDSHKVNRHGHCRSTQIVCARASRICVVCNRRRARIACILLALSANSLNSMLKINCFRHRMHVCAHVNVFFLQRPDFDD